MKTDPTLLAYNRAWRAEHAEELAAKARAKYRKQREDPDWYARRLEQNRRNRRKTRP